MKSIISLAVLYFTGLFASTADSVERKIENRNTGSFYGIVVNTNANVIITQSENSSVQIAGTAGAINRITTEVVNGALMINGQGGRTVDIYITVEDLNLIEVNGSARIMGNGTFSTDVVLLKVNGSGSIKMDIRSLTVGMIVRGSGKIIASGSTGSSFVKVFGSGNVYASSLDSFSSSVLTTGTNSASAEKRPTLKLQ
jgi:hypothetical protein